MQLEIGHHQASARVRDEDRPCLHLWADVFRVALADARGDGIRPTGLTLERWELHRRILREGAARWFATDDRLPGSFLWCCSLFNLDAERVRAQLRAGAPPP